MNKTTFFGRLYQNRWGRVLIHACLWLAYLLLLSAKDRWLDLRRATFSDSLPYWLPCIAVFYGLAYFIIPRTLYKQRYGWFALSLLLTVFGYLLLDYAASYLFIRLFTVHNAYTLQYYHTQLTGGSLLNPGIFLTKVFGLLYLIALPLVLKVSRDVFGFRNQALSLQKDNLQLELNFLKAQINPHFLFNTLNNLDSLITLEENGRASEVVMKLAAFMRYTLYECEGEWIPLNKEAELIQNYIALEKIRHDRVKIDFTITPLPGHLQIPPLLLLPLIENAFKHGVDAAFTESRVYLNLKGGDGRIEFSVENTVPSVPVQAPGGIGLANVRKRLQHYYPGRHQLTIENPPGFFRVNLMITL